MSRRLGLWLGAALLVALLLGWRMADGATGPASIAGLVCVLAVAAGLGLLHRVLLTRVPESVAAWTGVLLLLTTPLLQIATSDARADRALEFLAMAAVLAAVAAVHSRRNQLLVLVMSFVALTLWMEQTGADWQRPDLLATVFGSRGGLLFWHPLLWLGVLGCVARSKAAPFRSVVLLALTSLLLLDSAAGAAGVDRPALLPWLGLGVAASLARVYTLAARRPGVLLAAAAVMLTAWNLLFMEQFRRNLLPRDATVSFANVASQNAALVSDSVGSPVAWPANWVFAARTGLPPAQYDLLAGRWLLDDGLQSVVDVGAGGDNDSDQAFLGEGWGVRQACEAGLCRDVLGGAVILAPLRQAVDLDLTVRARGEGALTLTLNGTPAGAWPLGLALHDFTIRVPAGRWRSGLNTVTLGHDEGGGRRASVDRLVLRRVPGAPR